MENRLIELETRLAYQEATLQELNTIVAEQSQQIERLERVCRELASRIARGMDNVHKGSAEDELPPHY